jgi:hypothetical protein
VKNWRGELRETRSILEQAVPEVLHAERDDYFAALRLVLLHRPDGLRRWLRVKRFLV